MAYGYLVTLERDDNINTDELKQALTQSVQETYGFKKVTLNKMPAHDGCVNTVFHMCSTEAEGYVNYNKIGQKYGRSAR